MVPIAAVREIEFVAEKADLSDCSAVRLKLKLPDDDLEDWLMFAGFEVRRRL